MTAIAQRGGAADRLDEDAVRGGGALRLHVREWGRPDGTPILFIHGWSQNHLCWVKVRERAGRRVPARRLRPPRPRHVWAPLERALCQRRALGRRRGGDHR